MPFQKWNQLVQDNKIIFNLVNKVWSIKNKMFANIYIVKSSLCVWFSNKKFIIYSKWNIGELRGKLDLSRTIQIVLAKLTAVSMLQGSYLIYTGKW